MSTLKFIATKQMLVEAERPFVVASSIDYLSATFEFSSEWQGCANTAIFRRQDGTPFSVQLDENNACTVPWEVIQCPYFTVSVFGVCGSKRITTNRVVIKVERCGFATGETPEDPTPTVYESIIGKLDSMGSAAMCDIGTSAGNVPVLNTDGKIDQSILPGSLSGDESDPIFTASPAHGITAEDIEKWNSDETDPIFTASPAYGIKSEDIEKWNNNTSSGFSGDYNDLTNKPTLADLEGSVPVEKGGTGAATVEGAWQNLRIYTDISQLGLSYPTTTTKIFQAMPVGSIGLFAFESKYQTVTDAPVSYGIFSVFYPATERPLLLCQQCISTGSNYSGFYAGYYNSSGKKMNWYRIFNGSMQATIAQGGTGATTAEKALENLGAASSADVGDVSTLSTTDKTIVGAINELYSLINSGG